MIDNNIKLTEGDLVVIREDLEPYMDRSDALFYVIEDMIEYRGRIARITHANSNTYEIDIDGGECVWCRYMFDRIVSEFIDD